MIQLTPKQIEALPHIEWLLDMALPPDHSNRATGRSFVMMIAFLNLAKRNPGRFISVFDHFNHTRNNRYMLDNIINLAKQEGLNIKCKYSDNSLCIIEK